MKLGPLLAQFLYTNKRLDLPGIGSFLLDPSVVIDGETGKHGKPLDPESISFEGSPATRESSGLVQFISSQTGKMRALAAADLDSYLQLALQFLNIGKPFLFEGIGSLVKLPSGQFAFAPGETIPDKLREYSAREISSTSSSEESFHEYNTDTDKRKWSNPVVLLLVVIGIGLAIWGGYTVYKKTTAQRNQPVTEQAPGPTLPEIDSSTLNKDTTIQASAIPPGHYKFVVEVANRERGMERYTALKSYGLPVQMETTDSIRFKLYFILPATAADTSRVRDSISLLYTPPGNRAFVER